MGITDTTARVSAAGNGSTTTFNFNFKVFEQTDLRVVVYDSVADTETVQTLTTHYTVSLNDGEGGSVTFLTAPTSDQTVVILKNEAETQPESITAGNIPAATIEQMSDRLTILIHQIKDLVRRAPKFRETSTNLDKEMPEPSDGQVLGWDASGNLVNITASTLSSGTTVLDEDDMNSDSATAVPTQQSTKAYADTKQDRSTLTTKGDIYAATASNTVTRLAAGANGRVLQANSSTSTGLEWVARTTPNVTSYVTGSGTFSLTGSPLYLKVIVLGAGGGGGGGGTSTSGGTGGTGGNTTFGTSLLTANGGAGGTAAAGGAGGTATIGGTGVGLARSGANGGAGVYQQNSSGDGIEAGHGGASFLGSGGQNPNLSTGAGTGSNVLGAGGGGGAKTTAAANQFGGGGGGAGGYIEAIIPNPSGTYAYSVGAGGTAGAAGTSGAVGGVGGDGLILVYEYYQ